MKKSEDRKAREVMSDLKMKEKMYNGMSKKDLVNLLVAKDLLEESFEVLKQDVTLWYFVSDSTGTKYIASEKPKKYTTFLDGDVYLTDGEINIRVPKCMESMFPFIEYGDEPKKVSLSVSY